MRSGAVALLVILAACVEARPAPVEVAPVVVASVDAGAPLVIVTDPVEASPPPPRACVDEPCLVTKGTVDIVVTDGDIWFLSSFGQEGRIQLKRRNRDGTSDVEVEHDLRLNPKMHIFRMSGDAEILALATTDGLAIYDKSKGTNTLVAPDKKGTYYTAVDADSVYWIGGDCALKKTPRAGGTTTVLARTGETYCSLPTITLDDKNVYFADAETIYVVPKSGGKPKTLLPTRKRYLLGLHVDADWLYPFLGTEQGGHGDQKGQVLRMPKSGGATTTLATPSASSTAYTLVADEKRLYWVEYHARGLTIAYVPKEGGDRAVLVEQDGMGYGIAIDTRSVYWIRWLFAGAQRTEPDVFRLVK